MSLRTDCPALFSPFEFDIFLHNWEVWAAGYTRGKLMASPVIRIHPQETKTVTCQMEFTGIRSEEQVHSSGGQQTSWETNTNRSFLFNTCIWGFKLQSDSELRYANAWIFGCCSLFCTVHFIVSFFSFILQWPTFTKNLNWTDLVKKRQWKYQVILSRSNGSRISFFLTYLFWWGPCIRYCTCRSGFQIKSRVSASAPLPCTK